MTEDFPVGYTLRIKALQAALEWGRQEPDRPTNGDEIIQVAEKFHAFLSGADA